MKVLEILREAEEKLEPKGIEVTDPKGIEVTDPKGTEVTDPSTVNTGNWQTKAFSKDAWFLIFYTNTYYQSNKLKKSRLEELYKKLITSLPANYSTSMLTAKMITMVNTSLTGDTPEEITSNLIKSIQIRLGVTIGPSWKAKDLVGIRVKDIELVKNFLTMMQAQIYNDPTTPDPGTVNTAPSGLTIDSAKANKIASDLYQAFKGGNGDDLYAVLQTIKTPEDYKLVVKKFKNQNDDTDADIVDKLIAWKKGGWFTSNEDDPVIPKIDAELIRLGIEKEGKSFTLNPGNASKWINKKFKLGDAVDTQAKMIELAAELNKWTQQEVYKDLATWAGKTASQKIVTAANDSFTLQVQALITKQKPKKITVKQVINLWSKYYLGSIQYDYDQVK